MQVYQRTRIARIFVQVQFTSLLLDSIYLASAAIDHKILVYKHRPFDEFILRWSGEKKTKGEIYVGSERNPTSSRLNPTELWWQIKIEGEPMIGDQWDNQCMYYSGAMQTRSVQALLSSKTSRGLKIKC